MDAQNKWSAARKVMKEVESHRVSSSPAANVCVCAGNARANERRGSNALESILNVGVKLTFEGCSGSTVHYRQVGSRGVSVMAFVRRKGNAFYLVHNVRRGGKVRQLHLARLGVRARTDQQSPGPGGSKFAGSPEISGGFASVEYGPCGPVSADTPNF